ncbi:MAG: hypothetical protein ABIJ97_02085 [Bacteroidota bacterium]
MGTTGFSSNHWNVGDTLYNDATYRTKSVLSNSDNHLVAILGTREKMILGIHYINKGLAQ